METANKLVQFKFAADSELGIVINQLETMINLVKQGTTASNQQTAAIQQGAKVIVQNLGTINTAQQQTTTAVNQSTAAINQQTAAVNQQTGAINQQVAATRTGSAQQVAAINQVNSSVNALSNGLTQAKNLVAGAFALHEIKQFAEGVIDAKSKVDVFRFGLTQMLQSERDVADLFPKLLQLAQTTPFQVEDLMQTTIRLKAMGVETNQLIPTLVNLGNAAAVVGTQKLPLVAKAYTDVMNKGTLMKQEINQFAENGIPIYDLLAQSMGKTRDQIIKMAEDHVLKFGDIKKAFEEANKEGGRYFNMMGIQSQTLAGKISNLKDAYFIAQSVVGDFFEKNIRSGIDLTQKLITATIGSESAVGRTVNAIKAAAAAWVTYQLAANSVLIRTTLLSAALVIKEAVLKGVQIAVGTYNLAMYALNGVLSVNYNLTAASTVAAQGFWTALRANPIGVLVTIVGTLVSSYYAYKAVTAEVITILGEQELKLKTQQTQLNAVAQVALTAAAGTDARRNAIYQLIREYPEYFKGIDAEKVTNTQLKAILDKVNSSYRERIGLAREAYKAEQIANTQKELFQKESEIFQKLNKEFPELAAKANNDIRLLTTEIRKLDNVEFNKVTKSMTGLLDIITGKGTFPDQVRILAQQFDSIEKEYDSHYVRVTKLSQDEKKSMIAAENLRWETVAANLKKGTTEYKKGLDEHNKIIKQINGEAIAADVKQFGDGENAKKAKAIFTAKEIAVMTKQMQVDSLKDQIELITARMNLEVEQVNHSKKTRQEAETAIKEIVAKAEADKKAITIKYSADREALLKQNLAVAEATFTEEKLSSRDLLEAKKFDDKEAEKSKKEANKEIRLDNKKTKEEEEELRKQISAIHKMEAEVIQYNLKAEKEARKDGIKIAIDYIAAQEGAIGTLGRVFRKTFEDIDMLNGKTIESYKVNRDAAKANFDEIAKMHKAGSDIFDKAKDEYIQEEKKLTDAQIAANKAKLGLIFAIAEIAEAIKTGIISRMTEATKVVADAYRTMRDITKEYYNDVMEAAKATYEAELAAFTGTHEEKLEMMREFYAEQVRLAEGRDAMDAQVTFNARMLEINADTTTKISSAWDMSKGPLGPQTLFKVLMAWKEHNAQLQAAAYEREAYEEQLRQQRIQQEIDAAREIRDAKIEAIKEEADAYKEAKEAEINFWEETRDAKIDIIKDELDASKEAYREQVDAAKEAYSNEVEAIKEKHDLANDLYRSQVDAVKDFYSQELDALKAKQSAEEDALRATYDLKQSLLEQSTSDEIEAIAILDRTRNEALARYKSDEEARLIATRDRILATLTDEAERAQVTANFAQQIADVHAQVEEAKLDKSKGISLATKQLNAEQKEEAIRLKEEEKTALSVLDEAYQIKFKAMADERDAKLEAMAEANKAREIAQKEELSRLEDAHDAKLKAMADAQEAREVAINDKIKAIEKSTADEINRLKDQIAAKDQQTKLAMTYENERYRDFVLQANKEMLESQKAMAIAQIKAEIAILKGKRNIFNSGRINAAIGDMENAIRELEGIGTGPVALGDTVADRIKDAFVSQNKANKTPFNADTMAAVTEAYNEEGTKIELSYTDDDRSFYAKDASGNTIKIRNAFGVARRTVTNPDGTTSEEVKNYFEGTPYIEGVGYPDGRDTVPAYQPGKGIIFVDKGERILSKKHNAIIGGRDVGNEELVAGYSAFRELAKSFPQLDYSALARLNFSLPEGTKVREESSKLLDEMKGLRTDIAGGLVKITVDKYQIAVEDQINQRTSKYYDYFKN